MFITGIVEALEGVNVCVFKYIGIVWVSCLFSVPSNRGFK